VDFSEQPPSEQWLPLKYKGERFAEVWFKPEGEPFGLTFRIPQKSFQTAGISQRLTTEILLKAVSIATEEVVSWRHGEVVHSGMDGSNPEFKQLFSPPPPEVAHLDIGVTLKPPPADVAAPVVAPPVVAPAVAATLEAGAPNLASPNWQDLEARWNAIMGLEAAIETLRVSMENMRVELEAAWSKQLKPEEKVYALRADVAQWTKAKNRIHHALPKLREFVHRATWAMGIPERKKLGEFFDEHTGSEIPIPEMGQVAELLEVLLKERQVLSAQGVAVHQECKTISQDIQTALKTLQINAAANARRKRDVTKAGGKFLKDLRRLSFGPGG
jgi:hypothetical protein